MEEKKETQIDFVIAWVDGGDPAWQRERDRYGKMGEKTAVEEMGTCAEVAEWESSEA